MSIAQGSRCASVKVAKYLTGYSADGRASLLFDASFAEYIKKWKFQRGGKSTDQIGPETWQLIAQHADAAKKGAKAQTRALRLALGLTDSNEFTSSLKGIIKSIQSGEGLTADGVCGPSTWAVVLRLSKARNAHTANFRQTDARWKDVIYSRSGKATGQTIGNSGCGPTSMASVVYTLAGDKSVTPVTMCALAVKTGYRKASGGTDTGFFGYCAKKWGLRCVETGYTTVVRHCIDAGGVVICRFKAGSWWTSCGHFSPMWKYDKNYFYVDNTYVTKEPGKIKRAIKYLSGDCKGFYCIWPK